MLDIYPDLFQQFKRNRNQGFCLIVTPTLAQEVKIHSSEYYSCLQKVVCGIDEDINEVIKNEVLKDADIIFLPYLYKKTGKYPDANCLNKKQRFLNMICTQVTPVTLKELEHFLPMVYLLDPQNVKDKVDNFFNSIAHSKTISFINAHYNTEAVLTLNEQDLWTETSGMTQAGEVGVLPCGELAVTPFNFDQPKPQPIALTGDIIFYGHPILQVHETNQAVLQEQANLFTKFFSLNTGAIKLSVTNGKIDNIQLMDAKAKPAYEALEHLFSESENYRTIIEIGFGLNDKLTLANTNTALNETYGGDYMCIHYGIGVSPTTRYHLDVICPSTSVQKNDCDILIAAQKFNIKHDAIACPCDNGINLSSHKE